MNRPWGPTKAVADVLVCDPGELLATEVEWVKGAFATVYERAGRRVGRLMEFGPIAPLDGTPDRYSEFVWQGDDGRIHKWERVKVS